MNDLERFVTGADDVINQAKLELTQYKAVKLLLTNNDLACEIHIAGMSVGVCDNTKVIPIIDHTIKEIQKAIKGKPNEWE